MYSVFSEYLNLVHLFDINVQVMDRLSEVYLSISQQKYYFIHNL